MKPYERTAKEELNIQRFLNIGLRKGYFAQFEPKNTIVLSDDRTRVFMVDRGTKEDFVFEDGLSLESKIGEEKGNSLLNLFSVYDEIPEYEVARIVLNRKWLKGIIDTMDSEAICLEYSKDRPLKVSEIKETFPKKSAMIAPRLED